MAALERRKGCRCRPKPQVRRRPLLAVLAGACLSAVGAPDQPVAGAVGPIPGRIYGKITDRATGEPVAGAFVFVLIDLPAQRRSFRVRSDSRGRYEYEGLALGGYYLRVRARSFMEYVHGPQSRERFPVSITLTDDRPECEAHIVLERGVVISGRVVDAAGQPVDRCTVFAFTRTQESKQRRWRQVGVNRADGNGQYAINGLPPGQYVLMASLWPPVASKYGMERLVTYYGDAFSPDEAKQVRVGKAERLDGIDVRLRTTGGMTITGKVVAAESGLPIAKTRIALHHRECPKHWIEVCADDQGVYRIETAGSGPYQVLADARDQGYARQSKWIDFAKGDDTKTVDLELDMGVSFSGAIVAEGAAAMPDVFSITGWIEPPRSRVAKFGRMIIGIQHRGYANGAPSSNTNDTTNVQVGAQVEGMRIELTDGICRFRVQAACPGMPRIGLYLSNSDLHIKKIELEGLDLFHNAPEFQPGQEVDQIKITLSDQYGWIAGTAKFKGTGEPAVGRVWTRWAGSDRSSSSTQPINDNGELTLRTPVGKHTLHVSVDGVELSQNTGPIVVELGATTRVEAAMAKEAK